MLSRLKFDLSALAREMLDQLPAEVFESKTTTFLDPCMGGGQFVQAVEGRLREYGHSNANIAGRVFGVESNQLRVNYAINKHKLVGQYFVHENYLEHDEKMKFDVVIGNPPYQSGKGEKGGKHSLWRKFVKCSFEKINKNGYVAVVCPGFPYSSNDLKCYFVNNTPLLLCNDASSHFPNIGSKIKYWIVQEGKHSKPFVVDKNIWSAGLKDDPTVPVIVHGILDKIKNLPTFSCKQDVGYNSTQYKNDQSDYFDSPRGLCIHPIRHASTIKICYVSKPTQCHTKNKVMMTFSGYPNFEYFDGRTNPISSCYQMSGYIEVKDQKEANSLIAVYKSKLYTFLASITSAGMRGVENYTLPKVDLSRSWSDQELYKHFGLTQEEISYIEATINSLPR